MFPGIGMGVIMSRSTRVRDEMILAAAQVPANSRPRPDPNPRLARASLPSNTRLSCAYDSLHSADQCALELASCEEQLQRRCALATLSVRPPAGMTAPTRLN